MTDSIPNIWQMQARQDLSGLAEALTHADPDIRRRAAAALRILDAGEAVPALQAALATEQDPAAKESLAAAVHHLTRENTLQTLIAAKDVPALVEMLSSTEPDDVVGAAEALGELGTLAASEALVALFHNPKMPDDVRYVAAQALIKLKSAPAIVTLLAALERDDWQVRRNAAAVLGQVRATWATSALIAALDDPNKIVRRTAAAALRSIGTASALNALALLESEKGEPGESR